MEWEKQTVQQKSLPDRFRPGRKWAILTCPSTRPTISSVGRKEGFLMKGGRHGVPRTEGEGHPGKGVAVPRGGFPRGPRERSEPNDVTQQKQSVTSPACKHSDRRYRPRAGRI